MPGAPPLEPSFSLLLLPESDVNDGTAEVVALEPRCGVETVTRLYGAGYAKGILDGVLLGTLIGRE